MFLRNVDIYLQVRTTSQPRRSTPTSSLSRELQISIMNLDINPSFCLIGSRIYSSAHFFFKLSFHAFQDVDSPKTSVSHGASTLPGGNKEGGRQTVCGTGHYGPTFCNTKLASLLRSAFTCKLFSPDMLILLRSLCYPLLQPSLYGTVMILQLKLYNLESLLQILNPTLLILNS
jgi:hypothetical protein